MYAVRVPVPSSVNMFGLIVCTLKIKAFRIGKPTIKTAIPDISASMKGLYGSDKWSEEIKWSGRAKEREMRERRP